MHISSNTNEQQRPRPVLMIPLRRCGSHALRLRLNFNPQFYAPYPLHIVDFMPLVELYGDLADEDAYFQMVIDVVGLQNASMVKWEGVVMDPVSIFDAIKDKPRSIHSVVWELLFRSGESHGASVVMDKSLDSVHYADELLELFDDMLFLNVVRDPRAQINSINRAIIHDFDTLLNTQTWVKAHDAARSLSMKYPEKVLTIRFEDFLANQETVLRRICDFFGLVFTNNMLDISRSDEAQLIAGLSTLWESNYSAPIRANIDKFKRQLSMEDIGLIESLAGEHMDYYGYERMTNKTRKITAKDVEAAHVHSAAGKEEAWKTLRAKNPRDYQLRLFRADYIAMVKQRLMRESRRHTQDRASIAAIANAAGQQAMRP